VAFENPDSSKLKTLLTECYLYLFGNRASIKKWKQHCKISKANSNKGTAKHNQGSDAEDNKDIDNPLTEQPSSPDTDSPSIREILAIPPAQWSLQLNQPTRKSIRKT